MTIPTRIIEKAEYDKLIKEALDIIAKELDADRSELEEDMIADHALFAFNWVDTEEDGLGTEMKNPIRIMFLNVLDPVIYKNVKTKQVTIIANMLSDISYEELADLHYDHDADFYCLSWYGFAPWDQTDNWYGGASSWWFKPTIIEPFELERMETH